MKPIHLCLALAVLHSLVACEPRAPRRPSTWSPDSDARGHTAPTPRTAEANAAILSEVPLGDEQDFEDARRGLVASDPDVVVPREDGGTGWNTNDYSFVVGEAPPSVHPSLWRQAQLNGIHGLFEVTAGIYQVRGYDLANMTLIEGRTGWILVDPLTTAETASAALALARRHLGDRPISALILTHSHVDHFGGIGGVLGEEDLGRRSLRIVAPAGFAHEATSENVLAGVAMARRATFMYGMPLARGERGHVDTGLGKEPARGRIGLVLPTEVVDRTPQEMEIDGVRFVFQYAPDSEAPAELTFYLPEAKAFCGAEIVSHTMHNLYTLRGSKAVYQWYFGWYDGNPANLDPLPPAQAAPKYVEFMGGAEEVRRKAREAFERGEYRWVAMVLNHLVFAEPDDAEARELLARAYDQLGYQSESGPWRDVYLTGAHELRNGVEQPATVLGGWHGRRRDPERPA